MIRATLTGNLDELYRQLWLNQLVHTLPRNPTQERYRMNLTMIEHNRNLSGWNPKNKMTNTQEKKKPK